MKKISSAHLWHSEKIETYGERRRLDMNQESVRKLSRVAFWGVIGALHSGINICYTPLACISPLKTEDLPGRAVAGVYVW